MTAKVWKKCGHPKTAENTTSPRKGHPSGDCRECANVYYQRYRATAKGLESRRRGSNQQSDSGKRRDLDAARVASGAKAERDLACYARKKAYIAQVYSGAPGKRISVDAQTLVVINDTQIPFEDPAAVNQALDVLHRVRPDTVVLNGDIIDCYRESKFLIDPRKAGDVIEETHKRVRLLLTALQDVPNKYWLGGNHEDRWRKLLWQTSVTPVVKSLADEHERIIGKPFPRLDATESFKVLYDTREHGFTYYPYGHRLYFASDNLVVTHGKYVSRHSGYSAKRTWEWLGRSCIVGHTHRMGSYLITQDAREHGAWENGCLCLLEPEYDDTPNWQQGLSIVRIDGPEFNVLQVPIVRKDGEPVAAYYG